MKDGSVPSRSCFAENRYFCSVGKSVFRCVKAIKAAAQEAVPQSEWNRELYARLCKERRAFLFFPGGLSDILQRGDVR